ncbi:MAG TPA: inositol monophosphatase family protein [Candidatus Saccharimonadales bacterium]|nr:inositol monophosphatase family protein [Candidatus Saccharimonadales bacterium]
MVTRIWAMSRLFDQMFASGIEFWRKTGYDGVEGSDVVGAADKALQKEFFEAFQEELKGWGIIAKEDGLHIRATMTTPWGPVVVTLDPVDGTGQLKRIVEDPKFLRRGVSIMIAIRLGGEVVAAYIFDLFSKELFFVRPGEQGVMRQVGDRVQPVVFPASLETLQQGTLLIHGGSASEHRELNDWLASLDEPAFVEHIGIKESLGLSFLKVVQGKAVAMARRPGGFFTPWDDSPVICLGKAAKIRTFWIRPGRIFQEFVLEPPTQAVKLPFGVLYLPDQFVARLPANVRVL